MKPSSTPPKAKSTSKSSKSATSKAPAAVDASGIRTPVQFVKGVGPRLGALLSARGIATVQDLLTFFPRTYEDRSRIKKVRELQDGELASLQLSVIQQRKIPIRGRRNGIFEVRARDGEGAFISLKWFHSYPGIESRFPVGAAFRATGTVKLFRGNPEIVHPEIASGANAGEAAPEGVVPVYVEVEGIPTRALRSVLTNAIEKFSKDLPEDLPTYLLERHELPGLRESIERIHFPRIPSPELAERAIADLIAHRTPYHTRLIYEEFLKFEYVVLRRRLNKKRDAASAIDPVQARETLEAFLKRLPFTLTGDQQKAVEDCLKEMSVPHPANRLIQGDVGSGKTAVALLCAACAGSQGLQSALMAPTEILAEQHYKNALKLFGDRFRVELLTGGTPQSKRDALLGAARNGAPMLVIGTHAVLEDWLAFKNLGLILIDEQHRFGVEQRRKLRNKGLRKQADGSVLHPHVLILTATPIPRTLALTAYGDLGVSSIQELPPGRQPIETKIIEVSQKPKMTEFIRSQIKEGRQAYFIFPLVEESEAEGFEDLGSAVQEAERLANEVFPEFKVGLLHGQLKSDEKAAIMDRFKSGEVQILVSTTVVEVGVDVPNANIMVIENAERFGLSQLHQLRGRVGRGSHASYCFLQVGFAVGETSRTRLEIMEETQDGFRIAEADLEIRGPGEFLGTRQSGTLPFRMANLVRDQDWLIRAREDVLKILKEDPELRTDAHSRLRSYFEREGALSSDLYTTG